MAKVLLAGVAALYLGVGASWGQAPARPPLIPVPGEHGAVPFELRNGAIAFHVFVAGTDVLAVIDNLANESLVDTELARAAGVSISSQTIRVPTAAGNLRASQADGLPVTIPKEVEFKARLGVTDLSPISRQVGEPVSFVLGSEYVSTVQLIVATGAGTFMIGPSGGQSPPESYPMIPLEGPQPKVSLLVGEKALMVTLDLSSKAELSLSPVAWGRVAPKGVILKTQGAGQAVKRVGQLPEVRLGSVDTHEVTVEVSPHDALDGDGTIGMGFLSHFDFVLDIHNHRLWLAPIGSFHFH